VYLRDKAVEVGVGGALNVEGTAADIINGFIIKKNGNICVLKESVGGEHTVVRLNNRGRNLRGGVDSETQLGFLAIVNRKTLKEERTETRASASTNCIEYKKALETSAVISQLANAVQAEIHNLLTNCCIERNTYFSNPRLKHYLSFTRYM
jgi:hypothetical protein